MTLEREIFRGTRGPHDATYMIVGEAWGSDEHYQGEAFVGQSYQELSRLLTETKIPEVDCFFTNVVNAQPPRNDMTQFFYETAVARAERRTSLRGLYPKINVVEGLTRLHQQIERVKPKLIICFGNYALWALTDDNFSIGDKYKRKIPTGIGNWRGSQLHTRDGIPLLPTYHPAAALRNWPWRYLIKHDLAARSPKVSNNTWNEPRRNFLIRPSYEQALHRLNTLITTLSSKPTPIAVDIETRVGHISCIGFASSRIHAFCIPFMIASSEDGYWSVTEEIAIIHLIRNILTHPNIIIRGQHFLYDAQYIAAHWHIMPYIAEDTRIMHHLCFPGTGSADPSAKKTSAKNEGAQNLNYISSMYCDYHRYWKEEGRNWNVSMDEDQYWAYNCKDCAITFEAAEELLKVISYFKQEEQFKWQTRQLQSILRMMLRGIAVDPQRKARAAIELESVTKAFERRLDLLLPEDIYPRPKKVSSWYRSNKQTAHILYDILLMPEQIAWKSKNRTVDDAALEMLIIKEPMFYLLLTTLQQYRSLTAFKKFTDMSLRSDNRMHSSYSPTAETFRWTSSKDAWGLGGNLQNLPKGVEE